MKARTAIIAFCAIGALMASVHIISGTIRYALSVSPLILNHSDSIKGTLFYRSSDPNAPYILFCAPDLTLVRHALEQMPHGDCPGGYLPLIKYVVVATPERPIQFDARGFTVNGHLLPNTAPKKMTQWNAPLITCPFGVYPFGTWAISSENPDSYDSRYFGPVHQEYIRARAVRLF